MAPKDGGNFKLVYFEGEKLNIINPDGTGKKYLKNVSFNQRGVGWVPFQNQIHYVNNSNDGIKLFVVDIETRIESPVEQLDIAAFDFVWSPDGQKIIFSRRSGGQYDLYISNFDGSDLFRLTNDVNRENYPCWSPDGRKLAFSTIYPDSTLGKIFVINLDGTQESQIDTKMREKIFGLTWAPNMQNFLFYMRNPNLDDTPLANDIFWVSVDGDSLRQLTSNQFDDASPKYSPNGETILYTSYGPRGNVVMLMDQNGNNAKEIGIGYHPTWSPDGKYIAYHNYEHPGYYGIAIAKSNGEHFYRIDWGQYFGDQYLIWSTHRIP